METIYLREIRHIIYNFYIRNKSTAYNFEPKSKRIKIICDMIKRNWIVRKNIVGQFLFVLPSEKLITALRHTGPEIKAADVPVLTMNLKWNHTTQGSHQLAHKNIAA
jgi:hypothetical protein